MSGAVYTSPLQVRRHIRASADRCFSAWTTPECLRIWWGPKGVECIHAEVDLRVGGRYRLGHRLSDGSRLDIVGEFVRINEPRELIYTWAREGDQHFELVTVQFEAKDGGTEVVVLHERIADPAIRESHATGWSGCLDGLTEFF